MRNTLARCCAALALALLFIPGPAVAQSTGDLVLVLDASGSMWGQVAGENKIVIARRVLKDLATELPDDARVALVAYGHRREGDCADVETVLPLASLDRGALGQTVEALNPKGKTPITAALAAAVELVEGSGGATVVLVSDGLETCGGDPCATVQKARQAGVEFVLHVVGFDVGEVEVQELECAAQAGGGLYFDAKSADELAAALDRAVAAPPELPTGALVVRAVADGELVDALVEVFPGGGGEAVAAGRTYTDAETNPRRLPLEDGVYDVEVRAVRVSGAAPRRFAGVEIRDGETVEKTADFSSGELAVGVTRNGELSDATVRVLVAGTQEQVAAGRSYRSASSNPRVFRLAAGEYDVEIGSVEISGGPEVLLEGIVVGGGERAERAHEFVSGELRVGAVQGGERVQALVSVLGPDGRQVAGGRTSTDAKGNPKSFVLEPGTYGVEVKGFKLDGAPEKKLEVRVEAGGMVEETAEF